MQRRHVVIVWVLLAAAGSGCGGEQRTVTTLRLDEVPPELMAVARQQLPGVEFDTAWKKANGTFEIRGRARNGKIREVDIRPDGSVEEVE